jgi:hypothetical protein
LSKLDLSSRVPAEYEKQVWADIIRTICNQVNPLSEGRVAARYNAQISVPSGGSVSYAVGDFIPDSNTTVTNGSVRLGWVCNVAGTPGTFQEARVLVANFAPITNSLSGDVTMNVSANYFTGPSVSQGTSGTWYASGTVTIIESATAGSFDAKLWDGTTVIASCRHYSDTANVQRSISLSGYITNPAGNIRISVRDLNGTSGSILSNVTGGGKDSTVTAIRIG